MYRYLLESISPSFAIAICCIIVDVGGWFWQPFLPGFFYHHTSRPTSGAASHRLWDVTELVERVVGELSRADQVRMAAACHSTWLIATPFVWKDLPQQRWNIHIISILPNELADSEFKPSAQVSILGHSRSEAS